VPLDGAFSTLHWLIVAVVALLVLGPEQLPRLARRAGETMRDFQRVREHLRSELRDLVSEFDLNRTSDATPPSLPNRNEERPRSLAEAEGDTHAP
jgi:TatA/E family protein of Tat protein translocase